MDAAQWTASGVQQRVQEKLRAMSGEAGGGGSSGEGDGSSKKEKTPRGGKGAEGDPYEPNGVKDADEAGMMRAELV